MYGGNTAGFSASAGYAGGLPRVAMADIIPPIGVGCEAGSRSVQWANILQPFCNPT